MAVEVAVLESGTHMGVDLKVVKNTFIVADEDAKTDGVIDEAKLIPFCAFLVDADQDDIQVVTGNKGEQFANPGNHFSNGGFHIPQRFNAETLNTTTMEWSLPTTEPKVSESDYEEGKSCRYIWVDAMYDLGMDGWQLVKYPGVPEMSVQDCYVVDYYDDQFHMNYEAEATVTVARGKNLRLNLVSQGLEGHEFKLFSDSGRTTEYTTGVTVTGTPGLKDTGAMIKAVINDSTPNTLYYGNATDGGGTITVTG
tara:strand:- start:91 stop:849 length:759 start_codon:yes stop_codon:yes gene_type:complete